MRLAVVLPPSQGRLRARLYELRLVRAEESMADGNSRLVVEASLPLIESLCREAGVEFAYPTQTLYLARAGSPGR